MINKTGSYVLSAIRSYRPSHGQRNSSFTALFLSGLFSLHLVKWSISGNSVQSITGLQIRLDLGLKQRLDTHQNSNKMCSIKFGEASKMVQAIAPDFCKRVPISEEVVTALSPDQANQMDNVLSPIVQKYGDKILLTESDRKPKISRKKERKSSGRIANKQRPTEGDGEWQGPPPWDVTSGGDGSPKFLCDVMVRHHI